jgi:mRNA interferase HigB
LKKRAKILHGISEIPLPSKTASGKDDQKPVHSALWVFPADRAQAGPVECLEEGLTFQAEMKSCSQEGNSLQSPRQRGAALRIIALRNLREFWRIPEFRDSEQALKTWYSLARTANWKSSHDVKAQLSTASIIGNKRVVFNIAGNKYRLVVQFHFNTSIGYVRFVGTHKQYDAIDAETI